VLASLVIQKGADDCAGGIDAEGLGQCGGCVCVRIHEIDRDWLRPITLLEEAMYSGETVETHEIAVRINSPDLRGLAAREHIVSEVAVLDGVSMSPRCARRRIETDDDAAVGSGGVVH